MATPPVEHARPRPDAGPRRLTVRSRRVPVSARLSVRTAALGAVVAALALAAAAWTMTLGEFPVPLSDVLASTFGVGTADPAHDFVVRTLRLPRVLAALLAGAALAASGAVFQGLVRNPLVAPDVIGVNAGASLVAVYLIVVTGSALLLPAGAFAGALVTAFAVYAFTWRRGISGSRLVLVGIGVNAVLGSLTTLILVRYPVEEIAPAVLWTTGTLYGADWRDVTVLVVGLGVLLPPAFWLTRHLTALQLGDDTARSLGVRAEPARAALITVGAGLAATAVAVAGPIGFVALIAPHIARMLAGPLTGGVLLLSASVGALLLAASDLVAQHAFAAVSLPAGLVTAAVGAPYFLFLLYRSNRLS
ncbi:iron chelate uptake ABC transporter family permease subunit [Geodermatophilus sp. DSM 44513]|uniref:FecCD family ABC transporter permease n=1 Tax=Geodermatophilus sp. DSM 44513 TaxID=1528104 RepID=UPI00126F09C4|nr:iron ABC transporter permease [Geodermatophilus sp. DSM 44513]WNV77638.1 iron ABC transporter permease [Geodermatophilus sp. DSM 44513]